MRWCAITEGIHQEAKLLLCFFLGEAQIIEHGLLQTFIMDSTLLVMKKDTVKFEINKASAERVGIKFRSKLLRMAARVIGNLHEENNKQQK